MVALSYKRDIISPVIHWSFHDYVEGGQDPIENWYADDLSDAGKFGFDFLLKNTAKTENHLEWTGFKYLKGDPKKERIWQLDFLADRRQYRLLGVFGQIRRQAILLVGCHHKGKNYTPANALDTAIRRARSLREKRAGTRERKIKLDI
jgi:hypothetical protein